MLHQHSYDNPTMPLLMGFTPPTPIQTAEGVERYIYDSYRQITEYDMATIGTKCLKTSSTRIGKLTGTFKSDHKNEIDDSKSK